MVFKGNSVAYLAIYPKMHVTNTSSVTYLTTCYRISTHGRAVTSIPYVSGEQVLVARRSSRVTKDETAICPMDKDKGWHDCSLGADSTGFGKSLTFRSATSGTLRHDVGDVALPTSLLRLVLFQHLNQPRRRCNSQNSHESANFFSLFLSMAADVLKSALLDLNREI